LISLALRPYQREAIAAVREAWGRGIRRPAVVLPTGAGKTVVFSHLVREMRDLGVRSVIFAHRDELIEQAAAKLRAVAPDLRIGIYKAARREIRRRDAVVASVQSLTRPERRAELAAAGLRLVIVDEAHHAVANTYMEALRALDAFSDDPLTGAYALGVTATLARSDRVALGQVWQEVVYRRSILDMIKDGYLVNAKGIRVRIEGLDLSRVARSRGDFRDGALGEAMSAALAPKAIVRAWHEHASGRPTIAFTPTVAFAHELSDAFSAEGVRSAVVEGGMPLGERRAVLAAYARGELDVVCNCAVLTEGYDAPWCSCVLIARPTNSGALYVQMAGRGLRPYPGKGDALILDVVGATGRHRLASLVDLVGADRVEALPPDLAEYDELDLLGLDERGEGAGWGDEQRHDGPLTHEVVDLFGTRRQAWLRTRRGVWFLSNDRWVTFLAPGSEPGKYHVARTPAKGQGGEFVAHDVDLDMAMTWGEQSVSEFGAVSTSKGAAWRASAPTQGQLNALRGMGQAWDGLATRGEVSDLISIQVGTWKLDGMPCVQTVTERGYW
jgi:superfamily II DNA or RNA helicase